jgi:hypothetical protein
VISIAPRIDCANYDYDISEAMITAHCQVSTTAKDNRNTQCWERGEMSAFMDAFLKEHLLELKHALTCSKYFHQPSEDVIQDLISVSRSHSASSHSVGNEIMR